MNELRRVLRNQLRALVWLVALGGLVHLQVAAQPYPFQDPSFNKFRSNVLGNTVAFSFGGDGTPLAGSAPTTAAGGTRGVDLTRAISVNTKNGPINGTLSQTLSKGAMGKAFGRVAALIGGPVGLAFLALPAIVDWMTDAGVQHNGTQFLGADPSYSARQYVWVGGPQRGWPYESASAACARFSALYGSSMPLVQIGPTTYACGWSQYYLIDRVNPNPPDIVPLSNSQLEAAMSNVTNPSPEALAELYKLGSTVPAANPVPDLVDTLRADFEARSPESVQTTTADSPTESTTEQKKCATYTQVVGSTLSLVERCSTTTTVQPKNPETGQPQGEPKVTTKETTNNTPDATAKESENKDPCATAPNRVSCIELGTPAGEIPKSTRSVQYQAESVFGGGTCPPDKFVDIKGQQVKITDMPKTCQMLRDYVKPIALLLAAFTALMIVAVGMPE